MKRVSLRYYFLCFSIIVSSCLMGAAFFLVDYFWTKDIQLSLAMRDDPSILLDDEGNEWGRFQRDQRTIIPLSTIPAHVINAFIATEDWRFFEHHGISYKGILRSMLINLYHGRRVQGASTITQQLVRLLFFDNNKTFMRKIKEQLMALLVEQRFSKQQILEAYLNNVYFGCGIYGVEAAAQRFWGKHVAELALEEAAALAAVMRSPGNYCPLLCPLSCQRRRNVVLRLMYNLGFITEQERLNAVERPLVVRHHAQVRGAYVKEHIRQMLEETLGKNAVYGDGLLIQTTINTRMQAHAEQALQEHIIKLRATFPPTVNGGLVSVEVTTGAIKALVGGVDFRTSQFNRATQARRQMGSIFKPLVYAAAMERGLQWQDVLIDEPIEVVMHGKSWQPKNNDNVFHGAMTLAYALSHSINTVTVKLLLGVGIERVMALAQRCRISDVSNPYPSLALGCVEANMLEAIGMFNIFANHGDYYQPHCIRWVKDRWGKKIWKYTPVHERVIDRCISDQTAKVLTHWFDRVRSLYDEPWIASEALCKTGTTNDSRTCWFVGSTPTITTGIYIGCDDNTSLGNNVYPLKTAFPLWMTYNKSIETVKNAFTYDKRLREVWVNGRTGEGSAQGLPQAIPLLVRATT